MPYNHQPTSADHHRQGTLCYQDEALLLIPQIPLLCGTVNKYKAAMLIPGKEARGQDGLQRPRNSVVPAPEKKPSATEDRSVFQTSGHGRGVRGALAHLECAGGQVAQRKNHRYC